MGRPCSGLDRKKSWQGGDNDKKHASPTGSFRNRRARRVASAGGNSQVQGMDRSDPYQERAREMAREAGLDPDGRIERPGQRSMPVWCTFREAARKEHLALEAADAANTIAAEKPQARQFQNSPLKVFGEHDHATVAQMHNCMSVGNVVAGVVCADGHLGYAQPVGGVIAYEKQISFPGFASHPGGGTWPTRPNPPLTGAEAGFGTITRNFPR